MGPEDEAEEVREGMNINHLSANIREFGCCPESKVVVDRPSSIEIHLALEQQRLELREFTCTQIFSQDAWLDESADAKLQIRGASCKVIHRFSTTQRVGAPKLCVV